MPIGSMIPLRFRPTLREALNRFLDLPADLAQSLPWRHERLPPARLRYQLLGTSSRRVFTTFGELAAREILAAAAAEQIAGGPGIRILDFGCGLGRVAAPLQEIWPGGNVVGVDVDATAVAWCGKHLRGEYRVIQPGKPLPFPDGVFSVAYAINVFTHMNEADQFNALREIHRVLKSSGVFIATMRSPKVVSTVRNLPDAQRGSLESRDFLFVTGDGRRFNSSFAFHSAEYVEKQWSPWFQMSAHRPRALGHRDVAVFRRSASA